MNNVKNLTGQIVIHIYYAACSHESQVFQVKKRSPVEVSVEAFERWGDMVWRTVCCSWWRGRRGRWCVRLGWNVKENGKGGEG